MSNDFLIIKMSESGVTGAVGRVLGIKLKDDIIQKFDQTKYSKVILDFSSVDFVTSGFAKELFGGLYEKYNTNFNQLFSVRINKENDSLKNTIIRALATVINHQCHD